MKRKRDLPEADAAEELVLSKPSQSLASYWIVAFMGIALGFSAVMGGLLFLQDQFIQEAERERMRLSALTLVQRLNEALGSYRKAVEDVAKNGNVAKSLQSGGEAGRGNLAGELASLLPAVLRVRLLPFGHDRAEPDAAPPLSFAALDLMRKAEQTKQIPPLEIHLARTAQGHVTGVAPILGPDNRVLGTALISFEQKNFARWIQELDQLPGYLAVQQRVEGQYVSILTTPNTPANFGQEFDQELPVVGGVLRVVYSYQPALGAAVTAFRSGGIALLAALLAAGGIFAWQLGRMRGDLEGDQALLVKWVDAQLSGRSSSFTRLKIRELNAVVELLEPRLRERRVSSRPAAAQEKGAVSADKGQADGLAKGGTRSTLSVSVPASELRTSLMLEFPEEIFRSCCIQGVAGETLTKGLARELGRALGSQARAEGQRTLILARDGRPSGSELTSALTEGLVATGGEVLDLGVVPAPVFYFAIRHLDSDWGVLVASDAEDPTVNGFQVVRGGVLLTSSGLRELKARLERGDMVQGIGSYRERALIPEYIDQVSDDIRLARGLKVVVDCGNGASGLVAPDLFRALGCDLVELYCNQQVANPGHPANPSQPENLTTLQEMVVAERADLGLAFDSTGERLGVVDSQGRIIWPDRLLMYLSADILTRHPGGDVVFDVRCSRSLASQILQNGGRPVMCPAGRAALQAKMEQTGALLGGQWAGNILYKERWYGFDDALYAAGRLLELLAEEPRGSAEVFEDFPEYLSTPELFLELDDGVQNALLEQIVAKADQLSGARITTIDGLRAEYEDGWGLVRASENPPGLGFRFEADDDQALERVQAQYRTLLRSVWPDLQSPF